MASLTVMCGIPGSGKTSLCRSLYAEAKVVSSDEYRRFVTGSYGDSRHDGFILDLCQTVVQHFLGFGSDVVYDATNSTPAARSRWVALGRSAGVETRCVWVRASLEECLDRNFSRENVVPESVILRLAQAFVPPTIDEGFDLVSRVESGRGGDGGGC